MKLGNQRGQSDNWIGKRVRDRDKRYGKVIEDWCTWQRILTIQFDDGEQYDLVLSRQRKFKRITVRAIAVNPNSDLSVWKEYA